VEVLLLTDPIDEFWASSVGVYDKKPIRAVAAAGADLAKIKGGDADEKKDEGAAAEQAIKDLIEQLKKSLGQSVADVRTTDKLKGSPVCLVADTNGMSLHMARMLKQHGDAQSLAVRKILEINPRHALIKRLMTLSGTAFDDASHLLLDQARIVEGEPVADPVSFAKRLSAMMERALA
jgi:molecular chaperone HtpG